MHGRPARNSAISAGPPTGMELVQDPAIDLVDICTPNHLHYVVAKAALENNKHIFCEKPLSISAAESKETGRTGCRTQRRQLCGIQQPAQTGHRLYPQPDPVGSPRPDRPFYRQPMTRTCSWTRSCRSHGATSTNFSGSGALGDLGSHLFSISQALMGDITAVNACSALSSRKPENRRFKRNGHVENDDVIQILAEYKNGAIGTLGTSRIATGRKNYLQFEIRAPWVRSITTSRK